MTVLGGVFNKLSLEGFYNLEACKESVTSYFRQYRPNYCPYGFIPLLPLSVDIKKDENNEENIENKEESSENREIDLDGVEDSVIITDLKDSLSAENNKIATPLPSVQVPAPKSTRKSPSVEVLVDAFLQHVDFGQLLYDIFKYSVS